MQEEDLAQTGDRKYAFGHYKKGGVRMCSSGQISGIEKYASPPFLSEGNRMKARLHYVTVNNAEEVA